MRHLGGLGDRQRLGRGLGRLPIDHQLGHAVRDYLELVIGESDGQIHVSARPNAVDGGRFGSFRPVLGVVGDVGEGERARNRLGFRLDRAAASATLRRMSPSGRVSTLPSTVKELILNMRVGAGMSYSEIARRLNVLGIVTPSRIGRWYARAVARVMEQVERDRAAHP